MPSKPSSITHKLSNIAHEPTGTTHAYLSVTFFHITTIIAVQATI